MIEQIFKDKKIKLLTIIGFSFYFLFFIFGIIFKYQYKVPEIISEMHQVITFSLVRDFKRILLGEYRVIPVQIVNLFMNILLFIPLAIYLSLYRPDFSKIRRIIIFFVLSVLIETIQLTFKIGVCDTYDVLLNTIGAVIGVFMYDKIIKNKDKNIVIKLIKILDIISIAFFFIAIIAAFYTTFVIGTYWE